MKRVFLGSFIDKNKITEFYNNIKKDFKNILFGKWVDENNLHITYKFLGNIDEKQINDIYQILKAHLGVDINCELYFKGPNTFSLNNPRVIFIDVEDKTNALLNLNNLCENLMSKIGFAVETKPFKPHVTIMRPKDVNIIRFKEMIKKYLENKKIGPQEIVRLNLIESILTPNGPIYKILY